jgi:hypothetical protein
MDAPTSAKVVNLPASLQACIAKSASTLAALKGEKPADLPVQSPTKYETAAPGSAHHRPIRGCQSAKSNEARFVANVLVHAGPRALK